MFNFQFQIFKQFFKQFQIPVEHSPSHQLTNQAVLSLTLTHDTNPGIRRRTLRQEIRLGRVSLTMVVALLALVVTLMYLAHANRVATRGYIIRQLEIQKTELVVENEIWRQQVAQAKSLAAVQASPPVQGMRPIASPTYVRLDVAAE